METGRNVFGCVYICTYVEIDCLDRFRGFFSRIMILKFEEDDYMFQILNELLRRVVGKFTSRAQSDLIFDIMVTVTMVCSW